jgi:hypothetical protein
VVPEGPWEALVRDACPAEATLNVATVALDDLHQVLIHAVAEGRAPDLALLDSVWVPEFASSGFLLPLDELDAEWLDTEYRADVLDPFVRANRFGERTVAVQAEVGRRWPVVSPGCPCRSWNRPTPDLDGSCHCRAGPATHGSAAAARVAGGLPRG